MIRSFRNKGLRLFAETGNPSKLAVQKADRIKRILTVLRFAKRPQALDQPGYRFHALTGEERGRYAVWVSENYRITFGWDGEDAIEVDLEDYH